MTIELALSPEQIWQAVLVHFERTITRTNFEAYLKPTTLIDFSEDVFMIGCPDLYTRDWLESRLTSTVARILIGLLGQEVQVRFVVREKEVKENVIEDDPFDLELRRSSTRNLLLEPERVVAFPAYYLHWLPYVGAQTIFLVMAFWQEHYLANNGRNHPGPCKFSVRAERICRWAGISRSQFFRMFQSNQDLGWFLRKIDTDYEMDRKSGRIKKSTNKYELFEFPLTPGDAEDLRAYLVAEGIQESPESVLRQAANRYPKEIFRNRDQVVDGFHDLRPHPQTVQNIIRELLGYRLEGNQADLSDQLAAKILVEGDFLLVSWYFLKNWLPILGANAAMFVLLLRHSCFFNDQTGEVRDEVWMEGGYEAIARRLGIKNPREVAHWLPARMERGKKNGELSERTREEFARRHRLQDSLALFLTRTDHHLSPSRTYSWKFKVQRIDPLTPHDQALISAASRLMQSIEKEGILEEITTWIEQARDAAEEDKIVLGLSDLKNGCSETLARVLDDCFETLGADAKDCPATLLKILNSFLDTQRNQDTSLPQDSICQGTGEVEPWVVGMTDAKGDWSLEKLLSRVDRKNRAEILACAKSALPFLSWIIYGASQNTIRDPLSLAVARLKENSGVDAGGASSRLAALPPRDLIRLLLQSLAGSSPTHPDWRLLFREVKESRFLLLADALKAPINEGRPFNAWVHLFTAF